MINTEKIFGDTLILMGIKTPTEQQRNIIMMIIDDVAEAIRAYCRITLVPSQLHSLVVQLVVRQYRTCGYGCEELPMDIKSIAEGEQSVAYAERSVSEMLGDYRTRLKPYVNKRGRVPSDIMYEPESIQKNI